MLAPYAGDRLRESTAQDLSVHCSGIIEAYNALAEGQFPVRVAPSHGGGHGGTDFGGIRYPLFQFYGQLPYTAAGLLCLLFGADAFTAWKLVQLAALTLGGWYAYRCGATATRRPRASLVAGVALMTVPYMWADLHARFAFTELVSFNLLPVVTFYSMRAFASRRWGGVLLGGAAWSLLALSHNVTFLYASALLGLYFASHLSPTRRSLWRLTRVGLAYGLGLVLTAWYHAPQFYAVPLLNIRVQGESPRPVGAEQLTPLDVLLAPALKSPPGSPTERLGLQVGWPALAAAGLGLAALFYRRRRGERRAIARLLVFFAVAFLITWSPPPAGGFDLWRVLPRVFAYVQSSYRVLMFVALFGALLVPYALATPRGRDLPAWATLLTLSALAGASLSYVPRHERLPADALPRLIAHPLLDGLRDYLIAPAEVARTSTPHPDMNWAEPIHGVVPYEAEVGATWRSTIPVPEIRSGRGALLIAGIVRPGTNEGITLRATLDNHPLEPVELAPGEFRVALPIAEPLAAGAVPLELTGPVLLRELRVSDSEAPPGRAFVSAGEAMADTRRGARTVYAAELPERSLVQLPVLYYPRLLRVRVDGQDVPYGNVGRFVAVDLPAGRRDVAVEFVGVRWANGLSAAAWVGVLAGLAVLALRRARRAVRPRPLPRRPGRDAGVRAWEFALAAVLPFGIIGAVPVAEGVRHALYVPLKCTVTASRPGDEAHPPDHAFDGDETTYWFVPGGAPATLTIEPERADKFRRITFVARKSGLWETWRKVRVQLHLRGEPVFEKEFAFDDADTQPEQEVRFKATRANRVTLHFSDPVTVTRDGKTRVDPNAVSPGYREIRIE